MFSFMASQAIALSQAKQEANTAPATGQRTHVQHARKGFFSRLLDGMVEARMRRAEIEFATIAACTKRVPQMITSET